MNRVDREKRDREIVELFDGGLSLAEIAARVGLTSERVRQICVRERPDRPRVVRDPLRVAKVLRLGLAGESRGVLRGEPAYVRRWVDGLPVDPFAAPRCAPRDTSRMVAALRAAADGGVLSYAGFVDWSREHGGPSVNDVLAVFGTFGDACLAADVRFLGKRHRRAWADEDVFRFLRDCADAAFEAGVRPTFRFYERWHSRGMPSTGLMRRMWSGVWPHEVMQERFRERLAGLYGPTLECLEGGVWVDGVVL